MKLVSVVGARPQFIKADRLSFELRKKHIEVMVHTGQHYDYGMSEVFFKDIGLPSPDYHLGIGSGSHGVQTGAMLEAVEKVLQAETPDAVIVYGDTNSTLAGALAAVKLHIPVAHIEAGLRSFNRIMPEEINRVVVDHIATWLFAPSESSRRQLMNEGINKGVHVVGDIMLDSLLFNQQRINENSAVLERLRLQAKEYYIATIHRAENTDSPERLKNIFKALSCLDKKVVLPLHPRTKHKLEECCISPHENIAIIEPQSYTDMLRLQSVSICVLTDSGGMQKEAYYLKVPCVTLREETEWVETVETGWNVSCGTNPAQILAAIKQVSSNKDKSHPNIYGDGTSAKRIVNILTDELK